MIEVGIAGRLCWALVDSGADFSMINSALYDDFRDVMGVKMQPSERSAVGVGGERVPILGELRELTLRVQHKQLACPTMSVVDGLIHDIVLGRDFCCEMGTVLDDRQGTLQIQDMKINLPTYEEIRPQRSRVKIATAVVIPPRTEAIVWAKLHPVDGKLLENDPRPLEGIIEPSSKSNHEEILVPRMVATMSGDGTVPVRITNTTTEEANVLEGSDIGTFYTISEKEEGEYHLCEGGNIESAETNPKPVPGLDLTCPDLSKVGREKLQDLTNRFRDIFSSNPDDIGTTNLLQHPINTGDAPPVKQQPRRVPLRIREQVEAQKEKMLANGVIEESSSPWCSPVVLARKRDGSIRFCVDLRAVNSVTRPVAYPLPRIDEALDGLSGAKFFTTLDMTSGYWQVEIAPEDREKTAFSTGKGLHHFRKMAMGLRNAGATFQRLMELVLAGVDARSCLVYLDDVVLFNKTEEGHLRTLEEVFACIRKAGLKLKPQKCFIGKKEVTFLGHQVSREGVRPDPANIEKVLSWPKPSNDVEAKGFLGLCGYYAKFIPEYAEVSKPLREAANQKGAIRWTTELAVSFDKLKKKLASPPVLSLPTFNGIFRLYTDACNTSIGAVLTEEVEGKEKVVAYESKVLSRQQRRWPTYDKELWAVVHAIRRFRQYTTGAPFQVITDHKPLANIPKSIASERDGTGRRGRWAIELSSFEFEVIIKAGTEHVNADALSRRPNTDSERQEQENEPADALEHTQMQGSIEDAIPCSIPELSGSEHPNFQNPCQVCSAEGEAEKKQHRRDGIGGDECGISSAQETYTPDSHPKRSQQTSDSPGRQEGEETQYIPEEQTKILCAQREDLLLGGIEELLKSTVKPTRQQLREQLGEWVYLLSRWEDVAIESGLLGLSENRHGRTRFQVLVPGKLREDVLKWAHEHPSSGHMGTQKTVNRLLDRFSWPGMCHQAKTFCRSCITCQRRSKPTPRRRAPMVSEVMSRPFERIALDITEMPLSSHGNKYALVVMDYFSKYVRIYPMRDQKAVTVSSCLMDWVYELGVPERLHSDQGPQFESIVFQELCKRLGIKKTRTTPYHPQSDGMVERFMRTLKDMVSKYTDAQGLTWDEDVKAYAMAYNSAIHDTTEYSPCFLVHGWEPRLSLDVQFNTPRALVDIQSFPEERQRALKKAFEDVRRATTKATSESARRYDQVGRHAAYKVGDRVWIRDHTAAVGGKPKLGMPYKGPGTIMKAIGETDKEVVYEVRLAGSKDRVIHHNDLKPLIQREDPGSQRDEEAKPPHLAGSAPKRIIDKGGGNAFASAGPSGVIPEQGRRVWNGSQTMPPPVSKQYMATPQGEENRSHEGIEDTPRSHGTQSDAFEETETGFDEPTDGTDVLPQPERTETHTHDAPFDENLITPYITRSGRRSVPVMKYQAGVSPSVTELKHKYELFLERN